MSAVSRTQLEALKDLYIKSGGRQTSAANLRAFMLAMIESLSSIVDDKDAVNGYLGIDEDGRVDVARITAETPTSKFLKDDGTWGTPLDRALFDYITTRGNVVSTGETDLYKSTLAAGTLSIDGDKLNFEYGGDFVGSVANKRLRLYFGTDLIFDSGALAITVGTDWRLSGFVIRIGTNAMRVVFHLAIKDAVFYSDEITGLDFTIANLLTLTGQSSGGGEADNDVEAFLGTVNIVKAAL